MLLIYSRCARNKIKTRIEAIDGKYEVGGVLLGYKMLSIAFVLDVTYSEASGKMANVEFVLDGEEHSALAYRIINACLVKPKVLGIWHSHVSGLMEFSVQDQKSNYIMAQNFNGVYSSIVDGDAFKIKTWYIPKKKHKKECITIY